MAGAGAPAPPGGPPAGAGGGRLGRPDAILEPDVMGDLRDFVAGGGQPERAVELLSSGFLGLGASAAAVCGWAAELAPAPGGAGGVRGGSGAAAGAPGPPAKRPRASPGAAAAGPGPGVEEKLGEHLGRLVEERFTAESFAGVFTSGKGEPPAWLSALVEEPLGRRVIYRLANKHRSSLLLNFAVQLIVAQGHEREVGAVGGSVAGDLGVFLRLLGEVVARAAGPPAAAPAGGGGGRGGAEGGGPPAASALGAASEELCRMGCDSEHMYMLAQGVLAALDQRSSGGRGRAVVRVLAGALRDAAARTRGESTVGKLRPLSLPPGTDPTRDAAAAAAVAHIAGSDVVAAGDVLRLSRLYEPPAEGGGPPPPRAGGAALPDSLPRAGLPALELLTGPQFVRKLLRELFDPTRTLSGEHRAAVVRLLALASAARAEGGALALGGVAGAERALAGGVRLVEAAKAHSLSFAGGDEEPHADLGALDSPVAALGMLLWVEGHLHGLGLKAACLGLLREVAARQPLQCPDVLGVLGGALEALGSDDFDFSQALLGIAVDVLALGEVEGTLAFAATWFASGADRSQCRKLLLRFLEVAAPPYSERFAGALLDLMAQCHMTREAAASPEQRAWLADFAAACRRLGFGAPGGAPLPPGGERLLEALAGGA